MKILRNKKGQSLIEYLVLVCLIAVGSMAVIRVVGKNVRVQFANVSRALGGDNRKLEHEKINEEDYSKRDFSDFMNGAASESSSSQSKGKGRGNTNQTMPGHF